MMEPRRIKYLYYLVAILILLQSCTHDPALPGLTDSGYPQNVGTIILTKCAISGCHNNLSYINSADLNLSTWDGLFNGSSLTGSIVIPYRPDFSSLCYFTNVDSSLGVISLPTMPIGKAPLTRDEYIILRDWIANGAPNTKGAIKFADNPSRTKFYITNRQCNVITVIDAQSQLQMRYVNVGNGTDARYPINVQVAPDRKYWYVSFFTSTGIVQKYSADNDELTGELNLGSGTWASFVITSDSKYGYFADNEIPGRIEYVDLQNNTVLATYTFGGNFKYLTSIILNEQQKKLYVGTANGNFIYNIDITNPLSPTIREMAIDGTNTIHYQSSLDPIQLLADINSNTCYIACQASNEIRVFDMTHDSLTCIIPLEESPAFISYSNVAHKLFVSCPDDITTFSGNRGSVSVIDTKTNTAIKKINSGYQPYGMADDDRDNIIAVVNSNISGPGSHHASGCGTKNGNVSFIDINTLTLIPNKQLIMAVFPYSIGYR